jgi:hypothetical protein
MCFALLLVDPADGADPRDDRVKKHLQSDSYTVEWGTAPSFGPESVLEVGDGSGHGFTLRWLRFRPGKDGVDVLSVQLDEGREPYKSEWPPDRASVTARLARLKPDAYAGLLRDLAVLDSAKLKPVERNEARSSSHDFWVYARLVAADRELLEWNWAGYEGSQTEPEFAKPRAAVLLALESVKGLDFKDHSATAEERAWASAKFTRDWKKFKGLEFHWWVRERYIQMAGVAGDESALPALREILAAEPSNESLAPLRTAAACTTPSTTRPGW